MNANCQANPKVDFPGFQEWFNELKRLAQEEDVLWVVDTSGKSHLESFRKGHLPSEEIQELQLIAEWRGCGCGGGS